MANSKWDEGVPGPRTTACYTRCAISASARSTLKKVGVALCLFVWFLVFSFWFFFFFPKNLLRYSVYSISFPGYLCEFLYFFPVWFCINPLCSCTLTTAQSFDEGKPPGYDRVRREEIIRKDIVLEEVQEVFTSEHWLVRIYRVSPPQNRGLLEET